MDKDNILNTTDKVIKENITEEEVNTFKSGYKEFKKGWKETFHLMCCQIQKNIQKGFAPLGESTFRKYSNDLTLIPSKDFNIIFCIMITAFDITMIEMQAKINNSYDNTRKKISELLNNRIHE